MSIRIALGARQRSVAAMVARRGLSLVAVGSVIGAGGAVAGARTLESQLFGVSAGDPATFAAVVALLFVVAAIASYVPARRAARIDPVVALRQQ